MFDKLRSWKNTVKETYRNIPTKANFYFGLATGAAGVIMAVSSVTVGPTTAAIISTIGSVPLWAYLIIIFKNSRTTAHAEIERTIKLMEASGVEADPRSYENKAAKLALGGEIFSYIGLMFSLFKNGTVLVQALKNHSPADITCDSYCALKTLGDAGVGAATGAALVVFNSLGDKLNKLVIQFHNLQLRAEVSQMALQTMRAPESAALILSGERPVFADDGLLADPGSPTKSIGSDDEKSPLHTPDKLESPKNPSTIVRIT